MQHRIRALVTILLALLLAFSMVACQTDGDTETDTDAGTDTSSDSGDADMGGDEDVHEEFTLASSAYEDGDPMPAKYAKESVEGGENVSPPIAWMGTPEGTESFAVMMVDRHPVANEWIHWMVVDIPADATGLDEGASGAMPGDSRELQNTFGDLGYGGPSPPPGTGAHEYEVTVYALDVATLDVDEDADFVGFLETVRDHMIDAAVVSGYFEQ